MKKNLTRLLIVAFCLAQVSASLCLPPPPWPPAKFSQLTPQQQAEWKSLVKKESWETLSPEQQAEHVARFRALIAALPAGGSGIPTPPPPPSSGKTTRPSTGGGGAAKPAPAARPVTASPDAANLTITGRGGLIDLYNELHGDTLPPIKRQCQIFADLKALLEAVLAGQPRSYIALFMNELFGYSSPATIQQDIDTHCATSATSGATAGGTTGGAKPAPSTGSTGASLKPTPEALLEEIARRKRKTGGDAAAGAGSTTKTSESEPTIADILAKKMDEFKRGMGGDAKDDSKETVPSFIAKLRAVNLPSELAPYRDCINLTLDAITSITIDEDKKSDLIKEMDTVLRKITTAKCTSDNTCKAYLGDPDGLESFCEIGDLYEGNKDKFTAAIQCYKEVSAASAAAGDPTPAQKAAEAARKAAEAKAAADAQARAEREEHERKAREAEARRRAAEGGGTAGGPTRAPSTPAIGRDALIQKLAAGDQSEIADQVRDSLIQQLAASTQQQQLVTEIEGTTKAITARTKISQLKQQSTDEKALVALLRMKKGIA